MSFVVPLPEDHRDLREAVRALSADFPDGYWRRIDKGRPDVEHKFRETRLYRVAPVSSNLILAYLGEHTLGLPRSYCT